MNLRDLNNLPDATPILDEEASEIFLDRIEEDLKRPLRWKPTPGLKEARRIAIEAERRRKLKLEEKGLTFCSALILVAWYLFLICLICL